MAVAPSSVAAGVRHLYVHLPFCSSRCGYCDFVTVVGRGDEHATYVDGLLAELALERHVLARPLQTVFVGGGTPSFTEPAALRRLLHGLPRSAETTLEANPETVTAALAALVREEGVNRISLGAQSFQPRLLEMLDRAAGPGDVRRAFHTLRDACFDNISIDLIYGIPGQEPADLDSDLAEIIALGPEHVSCYELEAKRGTRFASCHGRELERQADAMEGYFERVVEVLTAAGYRWYETASFCRLGGSVGGRDLRAHHNLGYWLAHDYLGIGVGAVSTLGGLRRRNTSRLGQYVEALARGAEPPRELEPLDDETRARERIMLGLRLDEPLVLGACEAVVDPEGLTRLRASGLLVLAEAEAEADSGCGAGRGRDPDRRATSGRDGGAGSSLRLTARGRFLGDAVTAELLSSWSPRDIRA